VEDRLFKIRHCMNIEGIVRQLALFQPAIDPMQLVKAAAAGNNVLAAATHDASTMPHYRFSVILAQAKNIVAILTQFGNSLLSALEKQDAESIALLRSTHEQAILKLTTTIRENQVEEAQTNETALQKALSSTQFRHDHYQTLISDGWNAAEIANITLMSAAIPLQIAANVVRGLTVVGYLAPNIFGFSDGGMKFGDAINAGAGILDGVAGIMTHSAGIASTIGQYQRRASDWKFQQDIAQHDLDHINIQIQATQIAVAIAQQQLAIHKKQIKQTQEIDDFLKSKFTNKDLYQWMVGQLSALYFQTYKLALDLARAAQTAYQSELVSKDTFITMAYWDSLHKGLLAGEGLNLALAQMEKAYTDNNKRTLEIERTISLRQLDPQALLTLQSTGTCTFWLNELLFDYDFPGHYARQIKTISLSIPAVVGPYQNVNATLKQMSSFIVTDHDIKAVNWLLNGRSGTAPDTILQNWIPNQQIAISKGIDDSGLFVLNFNDERYLPFEGTGAVSQWQLDIPQKTNRFNLNDLSDVIINLKYTALSDSTLHDDVTTELKKHPLTGITYFDLKQAFATAWHAFIADHSNTAKQTLTIKISPNMFPYYTSFKLDTVDVRLDVAQTVTIPNNSKFMKLTIAGGTQQQLSITSDATAANHAQLTNLNLKDSAIMGDWALEVDLGDIPAQSRGALLKDNFLNPENLLDIGLLLTYEVNIF
ncbi:MAG: hypothetical protein GY803_02195, partial [Chloroflexi bacterium]|nr:hypothetical protein [Chloroflexota bacterium]